MYETNHEINPRLIKFRLGHSSALFLASLLLAFFALAQVDTNSAHAAIEAGATSMSKYRTHSGNYDYVIIGNTESYDEAERNCEDVGPTSDDLSLPSRSNVVAAYLYWSGTGDLDKRVKLNGQNVNAQRDFDISFWINGGTNYYYGAFADVTKHVNSSGKFTVSDLEWDNKGSYCRDYSAYGGWALVVVYENSSLPASNIYLYDGFRGYWPDGTVAHSLGGLTIPTSCSPDVDITHVSWEGDNYKGEHFYINDVYFGDNTYNGSTAPNLDIDEYNISKYVNKGDNSVRVKTTSYVIGNAIEWYINNVYAIRVKNCDAPTPEPKPTSEPTPAPPACNLNINSFTLVNADTNRDITQITNGSVVNLKTTGATNLTVRANVKGEPGSVTFNLDDQHHKTENFFPYALAGDKDGDYATAPLFVGQHRLEAIAYTDSDGKGLACSTRTIDFELIATRPDTFQPQICDAIDSEPYWDKNGAHSVWLRNTSNHHWLGESDLIYIEQDDGTATLRGTVFQGDGDNRRRLAVDFKFSGRTFSPPKGSPKITDRFPKDTSHWYYYPEWEGTVGDDRVFGIVSAFQVGDGANLKDEDVFGASGWFGDSRNAQENTGDINIKLVNCRNKEEPTPVPTPRPTATPEPASLGNQVWLDVNGDGRRDDGEPGVPGVSVTLFRVSNDGTAKEAIGKAFTDENGRYAFENLDASVNYELGFELPDGFSFTQPNAVGEGRDSDVDPSTGRTKSVIDLAPGETNNTYDAGLIAPATPTPTATDTNTPAPTDTPVPTNTPTAEDTPTNAPTATNTPTPTDTPTSTNTPTDTPTVTPTATNIPASIGNRVWKDDNTNGLQDDGELGVSGITVNLLPKTSDQPIDSTVTAADGSYEFTGLNPKDSYRIEFVLPVERNLVFTTQKSGGNTAQDSNANADGITQFIDLEPGQQDDTIDAGVQNKPATIGDRAWLDENLNDQQDPGEPGIRGVSVSLNIDTDGDGNPETTVASTTTDSDGFYRFEGLNSKQIYFVKFAPPIDPPNQFFPVKPGSDPAIDIDPSVDSDPNPFTGIAGPISLTSGEENLDIDVGYVIPPVKTPVAATNTPDAAATDTPVPAATDTPVPAATNTPVPADTDTPVPAATNTPVPAATNTPVPAATDTPVPATDTPTPAAGNDGTIIMIGTDIVAPGEEVLVMLDGFNLEGLGTATIDVIYDPAVLEVVRCTKDPSNQFDLVQCNANFAPNIVRFNVTALTGVSGDVVVAEIAFLAIGNSGDESAIGLATSTFANAQGVTTPVDLVEGRVIISDARRGDVNCDGERSAVDAMFTLQGAVGIREASDTCTQPQRSKSILMEKYCDTNSDENCDAIDALFTLQCVVGLTENGSCDENAVQRVQRSSLLRRSLNAVPDQDAAFLSVESIPAGTSGTVNVSVMVEGVEKLGAATLNVRYDSSKIRAKGCTITDDFQGFCNEKLAFHIVGISLADAFGVSGDKSLANIEFEVISELSEPLALGIEALTFTNPDGEALPLAIPLANTPPQIPLFLPLIQK